MKPMFENVRESKTSAKSQTLDCAPFAWIKLVKEIEHQGKYYRIRPMDVGDIDDVVDIFNRYYPQLYSGPRQYLLEREFYEKEVAFVSQWRLHQQTKLFFMGVIEKVESNEIIFAFGCRKDRFDRVVQNLALVLKPAYRGVFLANEYIKYLDEVWEKSGTDMVYGEVDSKEIMAQKVVLKLGGQASGIMPGCFRTSFDGKTYQRQMLIYMYKFYNGSEKYSTSMEDWNFAPEVEHHLKNLLGA